MAVSGNNAGNTQFLSPEVERRRAARAERHACLKWSTFIVLLLGGSVGMWIYAAVLAVSDPSMAVVPDYHEKALHWDKHLELQRAADALGWTVAIVPSPAHGANRRRDLTFFVRDRDARPVAGARGTLRLYHHARAGNAESVSLKELDPGSYVGEVAMQRSGLWQVELVIDRGDDHLEWTSVYDLTDELASAGRAQPPMSVEN